MHQAVGYKTQLEQLKLNKRRLKMEFIKYKTNICADYTGKSYGLNNKALKKNLHQTGLCLRVEELEERIAP